jgi:hypothetical protein
MSSNNNIKLYLGMHRKSMEVAQHFSAGHGDSSEPESSNDFSDMPKKSHLSGDAGSQQLPTSNNSAAEFAAAAAAAAAAMASEDFRSQSIAALRARAQQHSARLQQSPNPHDWMIHQHAVSGGGTLTAPGSGNGK